MITMSQSVLITGGSGFLGCHLARFLLKKKYDVTLLDSASLTAKDLIGKVKFIKEDIRDKEAMLTHIKQVDYVVHAAAALPILQSKKPIFETNIDGTKNVLEASLKNNVKRLVFISSTAVYGVPKHVPEKEDDPLDPIGYYGESKVIGEQLCFAYYKKGLSVNIVRPKSFIGPERLGVFTLWFEAIYNNKPVFILGSGNNRYQLLDVQDLCPAILSLLTIKQDGKIFNLGAQEFGTWRSDLGTLIRHARSRSKIVSIPTLPAQLILTLLEKLHLSPIVAWHYKTFPVDSYVSIEKAQKVLHFRPKKSNQNMLIESYDWYKDNRKTILGTTGTTHRTIWNFKILDLITKFL